MTFEEWLDSLPKGSRLKRNYGVIQVEHVRELMRAAWDAAYREGDIKFSEYRDGNGPLGRWPV